MAALGATGCSLRPRQVLQRRQRRQCPARCVYRAPWWTPQRGSGSQPLQGATYPHSRARLYGVAALHWHNKRAEPSVGAERETALWRHELHYAHVPEGPSNVPGLVSLATPVAMGTRLLSSLLTGRAAHFGARQWRQRCMAPAMLVRASTSGRLPLLRLLLHRAFPAAPVLLSLVRCPPALGLARVRHNNALAVFVRREGSANHAEVTVPAGANIVALIKAALAKLRIDVSPSSATLALAVGGAPLDPTLLFSKALSAGALTPRVKQPVAHARICGDKRSAHGAFVQQGVGIEPVANALDAPSAMPALRFA